MNIFNRIFTIISLVLLIIVGSATLIVPDRALALVDSVANTIHTAVLGGMTDTARFLVRLIAALVVIVVVLVLLWFEFRRAGSRHVDVAKAQGGRIRIHTGDVEARVQQQVDAIGGILTSRVHINEKNNAVVALLNVEAAPGTDLLAKGEEVAAVTRMVVQDQLGLKLSTKPEITMKTSKVKAVPVQPVVRTPPERNNPPAEKA